MLWAAIESLQEIAEFDRVDESSGIDSSRFIVLFTPEIQKARRRSWKRPECGFFLRSDVENPPLRHKAVI